MPRSGAAPSVEADVCLRDHGLQAVFGELVLAEHAREESAVVLAALEVDDEGTGELGLGEDHPATSVAACAGGVASPPPSCVHRSRSSSWPVSSR